MQEKSDPMFAPVPCEMSRVCAEPGAGLEMEWLVGARGE